MDMRHFGNELLNSRFSSCSYSQQRSVIIRAVDDNPKVTIEELRYILRRKCGETRSNYTEVDANTAAVESAVACFVPSRPAGELRTPSTLLR